MITRVGLLGALFFLALACSQVPLTGRRHLAFVPEAQIAQMGDQAWQEMRSKTPATKDRALKDYVEQITRRLVAVAPLDEGQKKLPWDVVVFDSKEINAFALPGGHIGVYAGLLPVAENAAALATVLAHEVGHVVAKHHEERVSQQLVTRGVLTGASAALASARQHDVLMSALGLGAQFGVLLPYSRTQESEADNIGLTLMARAGYEPQEAIAFWQRMLRKSKGEPPAFLSDHPGTESRIEKLTELMPKAKEEYAKASVRSGVGSRIPASTTK